MAIGSIQIPQNTINNAVDPSQWSTLSNLGNVYKEAEAARNKQTVLSQLGTDPKANMAALLQSGDPALAQVGLTMQQHMIDQQREDARNAIADKHWAAQFGITAEEARQRREDWEEKSKDRENAPALIARMFPGGAAPGGAPPFPAPLPGAPAPTAAPAGAFPAPLPTSPRPQLPPLSQAATGAMPPPMAPQAAPQAPPPQASPVPPLTAPQAPVVPPQAPDTADVPSLAMQSALAAPPQLVAARAVDSLLTNKPGDISGKDLGEMYANTQTRDLAKAIIQKKMDPGSWTYQTLGGKVWAMNSSDPSKNRPIADAPSYEIKTIKTPGQPDRVVRVNKEGPEGTVDVGGQRQATDGVDPTTLTGEEYLKTLDPKRAGVVRGVLDYSTDVDKLSQQGGYRNQIKEDAKQASGGQWNEMIYPVRQKAVSDFISGGKNSPAGAILAGGTTIGHLKELSDTSQKMGGPSGFGPLTKPINKGLTAYKDASDDPTLNEYNGYLGRVAEEGTTFYRGVGGTEADIKRDIAAMPPGMAQNARDRGIATQTNAMYAKLQALQDRWKTAMGDQAWGRLSKEQGFPVISRKNLEAVNVILQRGGLHPLPVPDNMKAPKSGLGDKADAMLEDARYAITQGVDRKAVIQRLKDNKIPESALEE